MQVRFQCSLTSDQYVIQRYWEKASMKACPLHPAGGCRFEKHGTYERVNPPGALIARWYCPTGGVTFSLLPDCLASRIPGSLQEIEDVVVTVEQASSLQSAANEVRSDQAENAVDLPGAIRWTRRRVKLVLATLEVLLVLMPEVFKSCTAEIKSFRRALGVPIVLFTLREVAADYLYQLPPPVGLTDFESRPSRKKKAQQQAGPDPP